jgi:hypothetical protein
MLGTEALLCNGNEVYITGLIMFIFNHLKEVSAEVTTYEMATHPIFPMQALPNSLCSPFSYLNSEVQNK